MSASNKLGNTDIVITENIDLIESFIDTLMQASRSVTVTLLCSTVQV